MRIESGVHSLLSNCGVVPTCCFVPVCFVEQRDHSPCLSRRFRPAGFVVATSFSKRFDKRTHCLANQNQSNTRGLPSCEVVA